MTGKRRCISLLELHGSGRGQLEGCPWRHRSVAIALPIDSIPNWATKDHAQSLGLGKIFRRFQNSNLEHAVHPKTWLRKRLHVSRVRNLVAGQSCGHGKNGKTDPWARGGRAL